MALAAAHRFTVLAGLPALLLLSACSGPAGGGHAAAAPARHAAPRPAATADPAAATWTDPARDLGAKVLASTGRHTGDLVFRVPGAAAGAVWVSTECRGTGTLTVRTSRYGSFTEPCGPAPDGQLDETGLDSPARAQDVSVTASPGVTWAVAVGWSKDRTATG